MRRAESLAARSRGGFTLAELIVVLTCTSIIAALFFGALTAQLRLARHTAQRVLENDALRTASAIIGGELRRTAPVDLRVVAPDSIVMRAFRGLAVVCATGAQGLLVHYRGDRMPDPAKDSALWLGDADAQQVVALASVSPGGSAACPAVANGSLLWWQTVPTIDQRGVLLVFESGNYYLTARALRYRLGAAGRQPLTADLFDLHATPLCAAWPERARVLPRAG